MSAVAWLLSPEGILVQYPEAQNVELPEGWRAIPQAEAARILREHKEATDGRRPT